MNFKKNFKIGHKRIGLNSRALIVAEISANHNQNLLTTKKLITSAIKNGADVIKIQTYTADSLTLNLKKRTLLSKKIMRGVKINTYGNYTKEQKLLRI